MVGTKGNKQAKVLHNSKRFHKLSAHSQSWILIKYVSPSPRFWLKKVVGSCRLFHNILLYGINKSSNSNHNTIIPQNSMGNYKDVDKIEQNMPSQEIKTWITIFKLIVWHSNKGFKWQSSYLRLLCKDIKLICNHLVLWFSTIQLVWASVKRIHFSC